MRNKLGLKFTRYDLLVIAAALVVAAAVFLCFLPKRSDGRAAEVRRNGELLYSLPLSEDTTVTVGGDYESVIKVENGAAFFFSGSCPGNDCVHMGKLTKPGDIAVCLPNGVELKVVGGVSGVDAIAG